MSFKTVGTEETNTQSKSRKKIYNGQRDNTLLAKKKRDNTHNQKNKIKLSTTTETASLPRAGLVFNFLKIFCYIEYFNTCMEYYIKKIKTKCIVCL
jgi:hypothetical protein